MHRQSRVPDELSLGQQQIAVAAATVDTNSATQLFALSGYGFLSGLNHGQQQIAVAAATVDTNSAAQ